MPPSVVLLLSNREDLFEPLAETLGGLGDGVEVHIVRTLARLVRYTGSLNPDALVVDWESLDAGERGQLAAEGLLERLPAVVLVAPQTPGERERVLEAGALEAVDHDGNYLGSTMRAVRRAWRISGLQGRIEETKQHSRDILEASSDGIFVLVGDTFRYVNPAFAMALGVSPEELIDRTGLLPFVVPAERRTLEEELARVEFSSEARELLEMTLVGETGAPCAFEVACRTSVVDGQRAVVGVARDVTAMRELQEEVERARHRAGHVERLRALGELAAGVAHNFNNALGAIMGRVSLARERLKRGESMVEDLAVIESAAHDAARTVRRIQEFARPSDADSWTELDLHDVAVEAARYIRARVPEGIHFEERLEATPRIRGNATELLEVLLNLLSNALEAVEVGGHVRIATASEHGYAIVTIEDDGRGIPAEIQQRIFEPFFTTKGGAGTGLGLSVSHGILRRHDAKIQLQSAPGEGTRFRLVFAALEEEASSSEAAQAQLSVVIVEDDRAVGEAFRDLLGAWGYHAVVVDNAREAARQVAANPIDVVFTDLDLPGMSGWQLARKLREIRPSLNIGLVTGWPLAATEEELRARGVDFMLRKPFTAAALTRVLKRLVEERAS